MVQMIPFGRFATAMAIVCLLAPPAAAERSESKEPGRAEFVKYCASCHGLDGKGEGPVAESLVDTPADLTMLGARYGMPLPTSTLLRKVDGTRLTKAHGTTDMPVWGDELFEGMRGPERTTHVRGTILVILRYLETIQEPVEKTK